MLKLYQITNIFRNKKDGLKLKEKLIKKYTANTLGHTITIFLLVLLFG